MLRLAQDMSVEFRRQLIGAVRPVLWESRNGAKHADTWEWTGLTDNYVRAKTQSGRHLTNKITLAKLLKQEEGLVYAQVL